MMRFSDAKAIILDHSEGGLDDIATRKLTETQALSAALLVAAHNIGDGLAMLDGTAIAVHQAVSRATKEIVARIDGLRDQLDSIADGIHRIAVTRDAEEDEDEDDERQQRIAELRAELEELEAE